MAKNKILELIPIDLVKSLYVVEGKSPKQISDQLYAPLIQIKALIKEEKLGELRRAYIRHGLQRIQSNQLTQANDILDLEAKFKDIRITQLKAKLDDYMAYYAKWGDFYRRDPDTKAILKDANDIPIQVALPNAAKEMREVKEAVVLAEGIKRILAQIEKVLKDEDTMDGGLSIEDFFDEDLQQ